MATKQLGTPSERPEDVATVGTVAQKLAESPDVGAAGSAQALRDAAFAGLTGEPRIGTSNSELEEAASNIQPESIAAVFGGTDLAADLRELVEILAGPGGLAALRAKVQKWDQQADQGARALAMLLDAEEDPREPESYFLTTETDLEVPDWVDYVDLAAVGKGGPAADLYPDAGSYSSPGEPGNINTVTLQRGEHFSGTPTLSFVPADENTVGSTFTIGAVTLTATDGAAGVGTTTEKPVGFAPQPFTLKGILRETGGDQHALGADGTFPGGAGNGRHWLLGLLKPPAKGGNGAGWVTFRADALPGEEVETPEDDTTAPDVTELEATVSGVTSTTLTITLTGAVDA